MSSGSEMGSIVGIACYYGLIATILSCLTSSSLCVSGAGRARGRGELSISVSLVDSDALMAILRVWTIFVSDVVCY